MLLAFLFRACGRLRCSPLQRPADDTCRPFLWHGGVMQALEQEAGQRLSWVVRLVQSESRQQNVFANSRQLAKTAGACCYACRVRTCWLAAGCLQQSSPKCSCAGATLGQASAVVATLRLLHLLALCVAFHRPPMPGSCSPPC